MAVVRKTKIKKVSFSLLAPQAKRVTIAGNFNKWDANNAPLIKSNKEGLWKRELDLESGKYEYKFVVDGRWVNDPGNKKTVRNPFGTENSLIEV